jgi:hypothetical protein
MGLIRAMIKAEKWIDIAVQKGQIQESQESHQHLLPFVMWRIQRAAVENIGRLFVESMPSITDSILDSARKLNIRESVSRKRLENMAQNATDPSYQLKMLTSMSQRAKALDIQRKERKRKVSLTPRSSQLIRQSLTGWFVHHLLNLEQVSRNVIDPHELVRQDRRSPRDSLRKSSRTRRKDSSHVRLIRKTIELKYGLTQSTVSQCGGHNGQGCRNWTVLLSNGFKTPHGNLSHQPPQRTKPQSPILQILHQHQTAPPTSRSQTLCVSSDPPEQGKHISKAMLRLRKQDKIWLWSHEGS